MRGADEEAPLCWLDPETALILGLEVVLLLWASSYIILEGYWEIAPNSCWLWPVGKWLINMPQAPHRPRGLCTASCRNRACCGVWWPSPFLLFSLLIFLNEDLTWLSPGFLQPGPHLVFSWLFFLCRLLDVGAPWGSILHALFLSLCESFFTPVILLYGSGIITFSSLLWPGGETWIRVLI
jgi:hypothetical protein